MDEAKEILQDPRMQKFIQAEQQKQKFQQLVNSLAEECFDHCVSKPSQKLGSSTEKCIVNCVERFIDTTNFVVNRLDTSKV